MIQGAPSRGWSTELKRRGAASVEVFALAGASRPAAEVDVDVKYAGYEIPDEFVVGFGLDLRRALPQPRFDRGAEAVRLPRSASMSFPQGPGNGNNPNPATNLTTAIPFTNPFNRGNNGDQWQRRTATSNRPYTGSPRGCGVPCSWSWLSLMFQMFAGGGTQNHRY